MGTAHRALFHNSGRARAVFVDSEPRVISSLQSDLRKPWVSSQSVGIVSENSGRGNNWAQGHYNSKSLVEQTLECVRKEVEACDWYRGASLFHALGGGTGAGAGTCILRQVRDAYPKCGVVSMCVAPSFSSESPVYGYNTLLSLWQLQQHADAIVLFNNDDLHRRAHRAVVGNQESQQVMTNQVNVPTADLNVQCALSVAGMLYPTTRPGGSNRTPFRTTTLHDVVSDVAPVSDLKYLDVRTSVWSLPSERERQRRRNQTRSGESWARTAKLLLKTMPKFDIDNQHVQTLSAKLIVRGPDDCGQSHWDDSGGKITRRILQSMAPVSWNLDAKGSSKEVVSRSATRSTTDAFGGRSMTCVSNRTEAPALLCRLHNKVAEMFEASAYLHWYEEAGCDRDQFVEAFASVERTVEAYRAAGQREARANDGGGGSGSGGGGGARSDPYDLLVDEGASVTTPIAVDLREVSKIGVV